MNTVTAGSAAEWRAWLARNSRSAKEIWLVLRHKGSGVPTVGYAEAIEQALCFGWIDSHHRRNDETSSRLRFSPRTTRSSWSALNRERAARMISLGLMTAAGQAEIDRAKAIGTWETSSAMPDDLRQALDGNTAARQHFTRFPPSSRRLIQEWISAAKRPETRRRRIDRTVELAAVNVRANHR